MERLHRNRHDGWRSGPRFALLRAAKSWGMTPGQFRALPYPEQLEMIAEVAASNQMAEYDAYKMEQRMNRKTQEQT